MKLRARQLLPAVAMTMLLAPAAATADTFTAAAGDAASLQTALDDAAAHPNAGAPDVVSIPGGTYAGKFSYTGDAVDVAGAGATSTRVTAAGDTTLLVDAPGSSVTGIEVGNTAATFGFGLELVQGGTVRNVAIDATGHNVVGLRAWGDASVTGARIVLGAGDTGVRMSGAAAMTIAQATLEGTGGLSTGVVADVAGASVDVARLRSLGVSFPLRAMSGGAMSVRDSLLVLPAGLLATALEAGDNNNPSASTSTLDADRVTIVGDPAASQRGAFAYANSVGDDFAVSLHDSLIHGVKFPLSCAAAAGAGQASADWSSLPAAGDASSGLGCAATRTNAVAGEPVFVDAAGGDYHQRHDSPLIDAGDPAAPAATGDLDGLPRPGGRVDVGAYEYQPAAASDATPTPAVTPPAAGPAPDRAAPAVTLRVAARLRLAKVLRRGIPAEIGCSEACDYRAGVLLGARRVGTRNVALTDAGTHKLRIRLSRSARMALRGRRSVKLRVRAIATDPAGNAGAAQTRRTTLRR